VSLFPGQVDNPVRGFLYRLMTMQAVDYLLVLVVLASCVEVGSLVAAAAGRLCPVAGGPFPAGFPSAVGHRDAPASWQLPCCGLRCTDLAG